jgi:hypothetical protein
MASDIKLLDGDQVLVEGNLEVKDDIKASNARLFMCSTSVLKGTFLGRSQLLIKNQSIALDGREGDQMLGTALSHSEQDELVLNENGGYLGGVKVIDRLRVCQKTNNTAGIWFYQSKPAKDQAFVGMSSDTQVGFYGSTGAGWGFVMDTTTGNVGIGTGQANPVRRLHVEGSEIHSAGSKAGFSFSDRKVKSFVEKPSKGERWVWYCQDGTARLWSEQDKLSVSSDGFVSISYGLEVLGAPQIIHFPGQGQIPKGDIPVPTYLITAKPDTGNVGIGTPTPSQKLHVVGNALVSGTLTATAVQQTSSRALKENIAELSPQEAISALTNLNPVKFNFKADSNKELHVGFIAEDVPELVAMSDRKTLSAMDIVAVLTKVVQEQQQAISQLTTEIQALKKTAMPKNISN